VVSNCRSIYGLRKVLLCKEILILSGKNLIVLYCQNKKYFFWNFWNSDQILVTLINWLLNPKSMLKHIFWSFLCCMKIQYDFNFERLGRMHETKKKYMFWRKPGILIPDLYFYGLKIQINIKQNLEEKYTKILQFFKKRNFQNLFFFGLGRTRPVILGRDRIGVALPSKQWRCCPLFTCNVNSGGHEAEGEEGGGGGETGRGS
jgi:hypothetical protein